jgi:tetratricopeptide (TPR) repeat protein
VEPTLRLCYRLRSCYAGSQSVDFSAALAVSIALLGTLALAQSAGRSATKEPSAFNRQAADSPALAELQKRLTTVQTARDSGDPDAIAQASRSLIALGLREMAHLRLVEEALPAAIDLYRRSLDFEDIPGTRIDLAIAYLQAKKPDDTLTEASKAIESAPDDPRGWHVRGMAYMSKRQYAPAADSLEHCIALREDHEAEYSLAIALLAIHQKEKAAAVFQKMERGATHPGSLHVLMARAYRDADYLDDAVRELKVALAVDPKTPHAHYLLGLVYLLQEEWAPTPQIREQFLEELKLNPRDFLSNYLLGAMESNAKNYAESEHYLKIATEIDSSWPEPWLYLGLNANNRGDAQAAESALRKAIELTGTDDARSNYLVRKAYFALGRLLNESGRKDEAARDLQKARELQERVQTESQKNSPVNQQAMDGGEGFIPVEPAAEASSSGTGTQPSDPTAKIDAAVLARGRLSAEEQKDALEQEKRLRPVLGASFNDLATSEALRQEYPLALDHYKEAESWHADLPGLLRNLGVTAVHAQNYTEAVRALAPVLMANPRDNTARGMLGLSYYMLDQYAETAKTITPLGDAAIKDPGLAYAWADSLARQGRMDEAGQVLEKLSKEALSADMTMQVGQLWEEIGNHQHAIEAFYRVLQQDSSRRKAHYYAGLAYLKAGRPSDADGEFRAELKLSPDDAEAKYHLGFTLLQRSQRDEAASLFLEVITAHPEHAEAQYQLGKILLDEGKTTEAVPHLEEAARLSPQADYIHYQLQAAYRQESRTQDADRELALYRELKAKNRQATIPQPTANQ